MTKLQKMREQQGMTRKHLSNVSGVALSKIYLYESGKGNPTQKTLSKLAKALSCEIQDLS